MEELQEYERKRKKRFMTVIVAAIIVLVIVGVSRCGGGSQEPKAESQEPEETNMVWYPGRTFDYKRAFNDQHAKQFAVASKIGLPRPPKDREDAASMRSRLVEVKTCGNYIVDDLTHSAPYLIPSAKKELDAIGEEWADILHRNGLPHYRFYVTSVLRTQESIKYLQKSGNVNSVTQSCHCYGTTFDLAYMRYDKVTRTSDYMHPDNLKLVLGQTLLNHQRAGKIYVKYEAKQSCFHITVRE